MVSIDPRSVSDEAPKERNLGRKFAYAALTLGAVGAIAYMLSQPGCGARKQADNSLEHSYASSEYRK